MKNKTTKSFIDLLAKRQENLINTCLERDAKNIADILDKLSDIIVSELKKGDSNYTFIRLPEESEYKVGLRTRLSFVTRIDERGNHITFMCNRLLSSKLEYYKEIRGGIARLQKSLFSLNRYKDYYNALNGNFSTMVKINSYLKNKRVKYAFIDVDSRKGGYGHINLDVVIGIK